MFSQRRQFLIYLGLAITSAGIATLVDRDFQNVTLADPTTPSGDRTLPEFQGISVILQRVGGIVIVTTAIAILLGWDVRVQLWLAPFFPTLGL
ncbi:MAG: hypothetical protein MUD14_14355 [Hydrococcus sp. Prado102]|jgi:hypothetical protein|nr:hypothetical protein [Hydrococcus sp. Prado102]